MATPRLGRSYATIWTASAISNLGDGITLVALPLLAATMTRDPALIAGLGLAARLPWMLFALIGGAVADRLDRRLVMRNTDLVRAVLLALVAAAVAGDWATLPLLYGVAFLLGIAETLFDNSSQAILPRIVPRDGLEAANGRLFAAEVAANQFVGPPLGGFLFAAAAVLPFAADAATFAIAALLLATLPGTYGPARTPDDVRTTIRGDIAEGLRWLWGHRLLRTLALELGFMNMAFTAATAITVLFALEILDLGEVGFGLLMTAGGIGSVAGGVTGAWVARRVGSSRALIGAILLIGATQTATGLVSDPVVAGALFAVGGYVSVVWNVVTVSLRQAIIPDRLLGRVNSVYRLLGWGMMPVGAALGGAIASGFGLRAPFIWPGLAVVASAALVLPSVNARSIAEAKAAAENG